MDKEFLTKHLHLLGRFFVCLLFSGVTLWSKASTNKITPEQKIQARQWMKNQPASLSGRQVKFLENKGQMMDMDGNPVPFVLFKAEGPGVNLFITKEGLTWQTLKIEEHENDDNNEQEAFPQPLLYPEKQEGLVKIAWERLDVLLKGATIKKENIIKENPSQGIFNFFYPHCPNGIYGVREYDKITIKDVYPGIDWVFYNSNEKGFKYDFIVHPGADYKLIELVYKSKTPVKINSNGEIELWTQYGNITENAPLSFLQNEEIPTKFLLKNYNNFLVNNEKGYKTSIVFFLPERIGVNPKSTLVIDPQLVWGTFCGGNAADGPKAIHADNNDNILITGYVFSPDFPTQNGGGYFQGVKNTSNDVFIQKFNNSGVLLWSTYYGGNAADQGNAVVTDGTGNIFVTGYTNSSNFPTQNSGTLFQGTSIGSDDIFIVKFNNAGTRLWATYYGGTLSDVARCITTDSNDNIFISGYTNSTDLPLQNAGTFFQGAKNAASEIFILKFDNLGNRLWATYYGGNAADAASAIAIDNNDNIFITGPTASNNFPLQNTGTFYQGTLSGSEDAYILKFDNSGVLLWASYYGGTGDDYGTAITTDPSGNIFVAGSTTSSNFPLQNAGTFFQGTLNGTLEDAFILKFDNIGARQWATYYGGSGREKFNTYDNIETDNCGNIYVGFGTYSTDLPLMQACDAGYYVNQASTVGSTISIISFNNFGTRLWASYLSGNGDNFNEALTIDSDANLFATGEWTFLTNSASYPVVNPGGGAFYDQNFNGSDDGYIVKFSPASVSVTSSVNHPNCSNPCGGSATATSLGTCIYSYLWSNGQTTQMATGLCAGNFTVSITNQFCKDTSLVVTINSTGSLTTSTTITSSSCGNNNGTATITVSAGITPFTYSWSNGQTTSVATALGSGSYSVVVTDASGCSSTQTVAITSGNTLSVTVSSTQPNCFGNSGTATVVSSGGTNPFTYSWDNGQSSQTVTGLVAGNYSVLVTDASGCTSTQTVAITQPTALTVSVTANTAACLSSNGDATATPSGGTPGFTYLWNNGQTTQTATGLSAGNHTVTVTDLNGCTQTETVTITQANNTLSVSTTSTPAGCTVSNGTATANASNGTPGYTYLWSNSQTTQTATGLAVGNYTTTVTDANGCTQAQVVSVTQTSGPSITASATAANISLGATTTLTATGGGTYLWSPSADLSCSTCENPTATPSQTTSYCVIITDNNGCQDSACITITVDIPCGTIYIPNAFSPNNDSENDLECVFGNCIEIFHIKIYNRWGEKVFESTDQKLCWDGTHRGKPLNSAVFDYYMDATLTSGEKISKKGNISLIR